MWKRKSFGLVAGSSKIEGGLEELEAIYKVIPEALLYGMDIDADDARAEEKRGTRRPPRSKRWRISCRRDGRSRRATTPRPNAPYSAPSTSIRGSPWASGRWARSRRCRATGCSRNHGRHGGGTKPGSALVDPACQGIAAGAGDAGTVARDQVRRIEAGGRYAAARLADYDLTMHVWTFDPKRFRLRLRPQATRADNRSVNTSPIPMTCWRSTAASSRSTRTSASHRAAC